jgi:CheY-like chemotaxis protein
MGLPDRRGDMLVRELRAIYPDLPIVIASGRDQRDLETAFKAQPKIAVIGKPYAAGDLLAALRTVGITT